MTDYPQYGLGAIPSPPDERDFPIERLYTLRGIGPQALPTSYRVPQQLQGILDQGDQPQCVAFSTAALKGYEDHQDQGAWFNWDEPTFYGQIGGGPNGAITRNAFKRLLAYGYPVRVTGDAAAHKIAAYYAVPLTLADLQQAILAFGPIVLGMSWLNSMFTPAANGVLRCDNNSGTAGGHAILCVGWTVISGGTYLILRNSWGASWGQAGEAYLPGSATWLLDEAWKAVDVIEGPTPPDPNKPVVTVMPYAAPKTVTVGPGWLTGYNMTGSKRHLWWHASRCHADAHVMVTAAIPGTKPPRGEFERINDGFYAGYWVPTSKVKVN